MPTTTYVTLPYPAPSAPVANGAADMQALANRLDLLLAGQQPIPGIYLAGPINFGGDTNLFRPEANALATDDHFLPASVTIPSVTGTPTDGMIVGYPRFGTVLYDPNANRLWLRSGTGWKYVAVTLT